MGVSSKYIGDIDSANSIKMGISMQLGSTMLRILISFAMSLFSSIATLLKF